MGSSSSEAAMRSVRVAVRVGGSAIGQGLLTALCSVVLLGSFGSAAGADSNDVAHAESLGLTTYYEGFPPELGDEISAAGAERLAELLADPAFSDHHATLIEALAASGQPAAYPALIAYANRDTGPALGPDEYRGRRALPLAMGRLAQSDARALSWLLEAVDAEGPAPFRAGPHDASELGDRFRRLALYGLGVSGRPEALKRIRAVETESEPDAARAVQTALDLHAAESR